MPKLPSPSGTSRVKESHILWHRRGSVATRGWRAHVCWCRVREVTTGRVVNVCGEIQHRRIIVGPHQRPGCFIPRAVPPSHDSAGESASSFLRFPLGAGAMRGVYVTVLVTTSRMCRILDRDSLLLCVGVPGALGVGGVSDCAGRLHPDPGVSAYRLDFSAASQSKWD